jgi:hypothetical protein
MGDARHDAEEQYRQHCFPEPIAFDGREPITIANRFGTLQLARRVCLHPATQQQVLPANAVLPPALLQRRGPSD